MARKESMPKTGDKLTRREMLRLSSLGVRNTPVAAERVSAERPSGSQIPGELNIWVTHASRRISPLPSVAWRQAQAAAGENTIVLNPQKKMQPILGFGAAFTDAACYLFNSLGPKARTELFNKLFSPSQMNFNVCRICIGSSDCSTAIFSYDDGEIDPDLSRFSLAHDHEYVLPVLRQAKAVNPDLFLRSEEH